MSVIDFLFGKPLATEEAQTQKIGAAAGIPIFGLDALGSAAYGPEAALTLLLPLGVAGVHYIVPISFCIIVLLTIVYFSYRQTIDAYPSGGGSYTVASQNLGPQAGLLAAAALMIDYVLVVAVGISAGIGALVSAVPALLPHTLALCLLTLAAISIVNLRGVRETGAVFLFPTWLFVGCLTITIALGLWKAAFSGGHPAPVLAPPPLGPPREAATAWLLLRAFSSGCTAMTGVEAVSNGVTAFREPRTQAARRTLTTIIALLIVLLAGIALLCRAYHIGATVPDQPGYQSVLSQLTEAVTGRGWFYYVSIGAILLVLALQANTAFADFPRLCSVIAQDGYLPRSFASRGRRLVYTHGIYVLIFLSTFLLLLFRGVTDRLIPLFAVGAFLAFTLSQAGMVAHWKRTGGRHARHSMAINGLGAVATAVTLLVVFVSKFSEGAWVTALLIPGIVALMHAIRTHYDRVSRELAAPMVLETGHLCQPLVVVPIMGWNKLTARALRFALTMSREITAIHVEVEDEDVEGELASQWRACVEEPARRAGFEPPRLVVLRSPYRYVITPIYNYILELESQHAQRQIAVLLPTLVERRWYQSFLHNQLGELLAAFLLFKGNRRIAIVNLPWYLRA